MNSQTRPTLEFLVSADVPDFASVWGAELGSHYWRKFEDSAFNIGQLLLQMDLDKLIFLEKYAFKYQRANHVRSGLYGYTDLKVVIPADAHRSWENSVKPNPVPGSFEINVYEHKYKLKRLGIQWEWSHCNDKDNPHGHFSDRFLAQSESAALIGGVGLYLSQILSTYTSMPSQSINLCTPLNTFMHFSGSRHD